MYRPDFRLECIGGPYGDACSRYKGELMNSFTLKDFVTKDISSKEWGTVYINDELLFNYSYGELEINNILLWQINQNKKINSLFSYGGWTLMDFQLYTDEKKEEKMNYEQMTFDNFIF